jgi:hypothetical protein
MVIKYTKIYHSKALQNLPKFGNHLANLIERMVAFIMMTRRKIKTDIAAWICLSTCRV